MAGLTPTPQKNLDFQSRYGGVVESKKIVKNPFSVIYREIHSNVQDYAQKMQNLSRSFKEFKKTFDPANPVISPKFLTVMSWSNEVEQIRGKLQVLFELIEKLDLSTENSDLDTTLEYIEKIEAKYNLADELNNLLVSK